MMMKNLLLTLILSALVMACSSGRKKEAKEESTVPMGTQVPVDGETPVTAVTTGIPAAIARANGFQHWDQVDEIRFTFNVDQDTAHFERAWSWRPKENRVILTTEKDTTLYYRSRMDSTSRIADKKFINDKYWLLAPFNLAWDADAYTSLHRTKATAPISKREMQKLTIVYKDEGGYTPGDAYDFYFEDDFMVREWVFRRENAEEPSLITSWEDYQDFDGVKLAKLHQRHEGDWKLYFTGLEVFTE